MSHPTLKRHPELKEMIEEAQQDGATHILNPGSIVFFFRLQNGKAEVCVAELSRKVDRFDWLESERIWRECSEIPDSARIISQYLQYRRPKFSLFQAIKLTFHMWFLQYFYPFRVNPYYDKKPIAEVVRELAYFRCNDCGNKYESLGYVGGPHRKNCPECGSDQVATITRAEYNGFDEDVIDWGEFGDLF